MQYARYSFRTSLNCQSIELMIMNTAFQQYIKESSIYDLTVSMTACTV